FPLLPMSISTLIPRTLLTNHCCNPGKNWGHCLQTHRWKDMSISSSNLHRNVRLIPSGLP
ncbi:hypothetical protein H0H93_015864, partial [Arthromyces matolae]